MWEHYGASSMRGASVLAEHARAKAYSWSSCRLGGCQNFRWIRSWAVLGFKYSLGFFSFCVLIVGPSGVVYDPNMSRCECS